MMLALILKIPVTICGFILIGDSLRRSSNKRLPLILLSTGGLIMFLSTLWFLEWNATLHDLCSLIATPLFLGWWVVQIIQKIKECKERTTAE